MKSISYFLLLVVLCSSCLPNVTTDPTKPTSIEDLQVSSSFNYRSTRDIQLNVKSTTALVAGEKMRINVYDNFPTIGNLITTGFTGTDGSARLEFRVPASLESIYVEKVRFTGASSVTKVAVASYVSADFKQTTPSVSLRTQAGSGMNCNDNCKTTVASSTKTIEVNTGDVVCVTGTTNANISVKGGIVSVAGTYNGSITMNGGTLKFCATSTDLSISVNNDQCQVYFLESANVKLASLSGNAKSAKIYNYSEALTLLGNASLGGYFENNGSIVAEQNLNLNSNCQLVNNGQLRVKGTLNNSNSVVNNNYILVDGKYQSNGSAVNFNYCRLEVVDEFTVNKNFKNFGFIKVRNQTRVDGGSNLIQYDGALLSTKNIVLNGEIQGEAGAKSIVKVEGQSEINGGASLVGYLSYCDVNGIEKNNSKIAASFFSCTGTYLPVSGCNPEGFGEAPKPPIKDRDGDTIPDELDDYPDDKDRATNTFYPSKNSYNSYAFEDLWPATGDYDFNDLVVDFRVTKVLNASNKVVDMKYNVIIRAIGASYLNGFGIQLDDVSSGEVAKVSGLKLSKGIINLTSANLEAGHSKAVFIVYDDPTPLINRTTGSFFNTIKANPQGTSTPLEVVLNFKTPLEPSKVTQNKINPFIFINGDRKREVHLSDFAPTAQANVALLGTLKDTSKPSEGRYYKSANNLPWGMEISNSFAYPVEQESIMGGYLNFASWALSGGTTHTDWYTTNPGNRVNEKIY